MKFSFVLANLGSNLTYEGTGLQGNVPRTPLPGEDPVPTLPQTANLLTKDFPLPTTFRVGLAYDVIAGDNNRLTVLGDFNQPNNNTPGFAFGSEWMSNRIGGSNFGFALRGSYSYTGANDLDPVTHRHRAERRGEAARPRVRRRAAVRDRERRVQPRPRLRVQVPGRSWPDELLQLHARMVRA